MNLKVIYTSSVLSSNKTRASKRFFIKTKAMFTLLRIRFYTFSYRSVLPVHTAPGTFENGMKTMTRTHCSALDKKENATNWFTALATAKKLFKQLTATNIPPSSVLTSSESAVLRKVVQIGAI